MEQAYKARCMKCKEQVEISDPMEVTMKSGMKAVKGIHKKCGTKLYRIIGKEVKNEKN